MRFGLYKNASRVDIDFDCTDLVAYGKTYEFSRKGYFPHRRGTEGYQFSLGTASSSRFNEILYLQLDPGNTHHGARFWDCIYVKVRDYYNRRQTIEAMIKSNKDGLNINSLRTRSYFGIQVFFYLACIVHNLITLLRKRWLNHGKKKPFSLWQRTENAFHVTSPQVAEWLDEELRYIR